MNKRDIKIYDDSWHDISEFHTEYDINIITNTVNPLECHHILALEKEFDILFPQFRFFYHLIESDPNLANHNGLKEGKLIYDAESNRKFN
jgi:hypothetical protein